MPTEREELRLTVSLVDNVSAGLKSIKKEFADLTEGTGKGHAEQFKKENTEAMAVLKRLGGEAGETFKAFGMMRLGALGAAGGVALLGFEMAKQIKQMGEMAEKMRATTQTARIFGINPEDLRNIQEQLEAVGVTADASMGMITKFMTRMGEMQTNPALRYGIFKDLTAGDPNAFQEMKRRLDQIDAATKANEKLNLVRQLGIDVERNAIEKQGKSPEAAAKIRRDLEAQLGYSPQLRLAGQLKDLTEEQRKAEEARTENMKNYANLLGQISKKWDEINKLVNDSAFSEDGIMVKGARVLLDVVSKIKESMDYIHEHGSDQFFGKKMEEIHKGEDPISKYLDEKTSKVQEDAKQQRDERLEHLRKNLGNKPLYFSGGGYDADFTKDWSESTNIEDRRGEHDDAKKYMSENTAELKRLNDFLIGPVTAPAGSYGFLSGGGGGGGFASRLGIGGGGGGGGGGINIPSSGGGGIPSTITGTASPSGGAASVSGDPAVPGNILEQARAVALHGGPGAVERFMSAQGYPKAGAWCGEFAAAVVTSQGLTPPKGAAVASNWRNFGVPVEGAPQPGDIAVRKGARTGSTGSHVTFVEGFDPKTGRFTGIGGNQGRAESQYPASRYDFRRPYDPNANVASGEGRGAPAPPRNQRGAALYQSLLTEFQKNPPQGLPPDAARFGITKGTPEEWARFGVSVAHAESGFNPKSANTSDPGGSFGVFQYAHNQVPGGNAYDTDASVQAFVRDANKSSVDKRGLRGGILGQRFSTIGRHPERGAAYLGQASAVSPEQIADARQALDKADAAQKIEGSGKITVDVNAPKGTNVGAEGKGLFKSVEINRQTQMEPAKRGPEAFEE